MVSRRAFIGAGFMLAAASLGTPPCQGAKKKYLLAPQEESLPFSMDAFVYNLPDHEKILERLLAEYCAKSESVPESAYDEGKEFSFEEGLALTPMIAKEVSLVLGKEIPPQGINDLRPYPQVCEASSPRQFTENIPEEILEKATAAFYHTEKGISHGFSYWNENKFYGVYAHELAHYAWHMNKTDELLGQRMKQHPKHIGLASKNPGREAELDRELSLLMLCMNEGIAELVQEKCSESLAAKLGKPSLRNPVCNAIKRQLSKTYIHALFLMQKPLPRQFRGKFEGWEKLIMTDAGYDFVYEPHILGTTLMKLAQEKHGDGVIRSVFEGSIRDIEEYIN